MDEETSSNIVDFDDDYNEKEVEELFFLTENNTAEGEEGVHFEIELTTDETILLKSQSVEINTEPPLTFVDEKNIDCLEVPAITFVATEETVKISDAYMCRWCKQFYTTNTTMNNHQEKCFQNPARRTKLGNKIVLSKTELAPLKQLASQHLQVALDLAIEDAILNIKDGEIPTPGNNAVRLAAEISKASTKAEIEMKTFSLHIQELLIPCVNTDFCSEARQISCTKFSHVMISQSGRKLFQSIVDKLKLPLDGFDVLYTFVITKIFSLILKWRNENLIQNPKVDFKEVKISTEEEKVLRYVSGYIPFSLKKRFSRMKQSKLRDAVLQLISSWCIENEEDKTNFYDYTLSWTNRINRGNLMIVKESFFIFIKRVEMTVRGVLNQTLIKTYNGEDLRDLLLDKLLKSILIESSWAALSRMLVSEHLKLTLKIIILKKWVELRIRSFITAWIQAAKSKETQTKLSKKAEVGLRKGLST